MIDSTKAAVSDTLCYILLHFTDLIDANEYLTKFVLEFALECIKCPPDETSEELDDRLIKFCKEWRFQ